MISIYYLILTLALATVGPYLLLWKKARAGVFQKLGFVPKTLRWRISQLAAEKPRAWFHAVSVGEFNALFPLLEEFHKRNPEYHIFVSTTTATGQELAKTKTSSFAEVFYFPFDLPPILSTWLNLLRPNLVGIVETEIWPGFMNACQKRGISVVLLNGRLSPRSFKGYQRWRWFFKPVLAKFSALAVQSESEKARFLALGGDDLRVEICGNIKLDGLKPCPVEETERLKEKLNLKLGDRVIVAGSTHEGEEIAFINVLKELKNFKLILVPRHPERFERAAQLIESNGFTARKYSIEEGFQSDNDIYLLDTIGQLGKFYSLADIAFVGGTLAKIGGHNLAEPCVYRAPVVCGPHIHKAKDLFQKLDECGAILRVHDEKELSSTLSMLLKTPARRKEIGYNGYRFLAECQGALAKTLAVLEEYVDRTSKDQRVEAEPAGGARR